jgi:hypothetical protein
VKAFIQAGYDIPKVKEFLAHDPKLIYTSWDWGGGDWETALAAAHRNCPNTKKGAPSAPFPSCETESDLQQSALAGVGDGYRSFAKPTLQPYSPVTNTARAGFFTLTATAPFVPNTFPPKT